ncbi:MAG: flagellar hook-associated protein FlgL [Candidatus Gastranaerophilales bacterium]|nr:flagellar hook-associated protein FlgL [Candidatus Gastranaerophilales bacterium]
MDINRTTTLGTSNSLLNYMRSSTSKYNELSLQASSGYKVTTLSDDPSSTRTLVSISSQLKELNTYLDNMTSAQTELDTLDSTLSSVTDLIQKATDLATQAANGTYSDEDLANIKTQVDEIIKSVVDLANTKYDGKYIFSGTATSTQAYEITYDTDGNIESILYNGTLPASDYERYVTISEGVSVSINANGQSVFGTYTATDDNGTPIDPSDDVAATGSGLLYTLGVLSESLASGDQTAVSSCLTGLGTALDNVSATRTKFAAVSNKFELTQDVINTTITTLKTYQSDLRDTDLSEVMSDLAVQQTALQATYKVFSQVSSLSLLDFM